jgi:hypothetical protein
LSSPNGHEKLFAVDEARKILQFRRLKTELDETIADLAEELESNSSFFPSPLSFYHGLNETLEKAIVNYKR